MNKTGWIILGVVVVAAIAWGVIASQNPGEDKMMEKSSNETMMEEKTSKDAMMEERKTEDTMMEENTMDENKDETMMEKKGSYKDYSEATVASEQAAGNKVVLFFHASWCPYCRAADAAFKTKADEIPAGVTVLKTDYDSQTELKTKYGVTTQHTFVQIDNDGKQVAKWISGDTAELKASLK